MSTSWNLSLGRSYICLDSSDLDSACGFYEKLGFHSIGEDVPGLRATVANGNQTLTFMTFLKAPLLNFRGGHIYTLMQGLAERGLQIEEYNTEPGIQLMRDGEGKPLDRNECGHFSVVSPDGLELLFNTNPDEREPYENSLQGQENQFQELCDPPQLGLHSVRLCCEVPQLAASREFLYTVGLQCLDDRGQALSAILGRKADSLPHSELDFEVELAPADQPAYAIALHMEDPELAARELQAGGVSVALEGAEWRTIDTDGRRVSLRR